MGDSSVVIVIAIAGYVTTLTAALLAAWFSQRWAYRRAVRVNDLRMKQETVANLRGVRQYLIETSLSWYYHRIHTRWNLHWYKKYKEEGKDADADDPFKAAAIAETSSSAREEAYLSCRRDLYENLAHVNPLWPGRFASSVEKIHKWKPEYPEVGEAHFAQFANSEAFIKWFMPLVEKLRREREDDLDPVLQLTGLLDKEIQQEKQARFPETLIRSIRDFRRRTSPLPVPRAQQDGETE